MGSVVKKKKETLLKRILDKIRPELLSHGQRDVDDNIPLSDIRTNSSNFAAIASMRNELKAGKQNNSDAAVIFSKL